MNARIILGENVACISNLEELVVRFVSGCFCGVVDVEILSTSISKGATTNMTYEVRIKNTLKKVVLRNIANNRIKEIELI